MLKVFFLFARQVLYQTARWTDRFSVKAEHDNKELQCIVTVPGLGSSIASVKLRVRCKYIDHLAQLQYTSIN